MWPTILLISSCLNRILEKRGISLSEAFSMMQDLEFCFLRTLAIRAGCTLSVSSTHDNRTFYTFIEIVMWRLSFWFHFVERDIFVAGSGAWSKRRWVMRILVIGRRCISFAFGTLSWYQTLEYKATKLRIYWFVICYRYFKSRKVTLASCDCRWTLRVCWWIGRNLLYFQLIYMYFY